MSAGLDKSTDADGLITFAGRRGRSERVERMTNLGDIIVAIIAQRYFNNVSARPSRQNQAPLRTQLDRIPRPGPASCKLSADNSSGAAFLSADNSKLNPLLGVLCVRAQRYLRRRVAMYV